MLPKKRFAAEPGIQASSLKCQCRTKCTYQKCSKRNVSFFTKNIVNSPSAENTSIMSMLNQSTKRKILFLKTRYNHVVSIFRGGKKLHLYKNGAKDRRPFDENSPIGSAVLIRPKHVKTLKIFVCRTEVRTINKYCPSNEEQELWKRHLNLICMALIRNLSAERVIILFHSKGICLQTAR